MWELGVGVGVMLWGCWIMPLGAAAHGAVWLVLLSLLLIAGGGGVVCVLNSTRGTRRLYIYIHTYAHTHTTPPHTPPHTHTHTAHPYKNNATPTPPPSKKAPINQNTPAINKNKKRTPTHRARCSCAEQRPPEGRMKFFRGGRRPSRSSIHLGGGDFVFRGRNLWEVG